MHTTHIAIMALSAVLGPFASAQNAPGPQNPEVPAASTSTTADSKDKPAPALEMTPELRHDIERLLAMRFHRVVRDMSDDLGNAFVRERFLAAFRSVLLAGKECAEPEKTDCPFAARMANGAFQGFDQGDFDPAALLGELDRRLAQKEVQEEEEEEQIDKLAASVWKAYRPIRMSREEGKERALLRMNAARPEVTTLKNGIQYETEPGNDSIRDVNRCTRETGIAFYTRTTSEIDFNRLPESVRQIADELPAASSWTFYVSYEAEKAVRDAREQEAKDLDARRLERLQKLLPGRVKEYKPAEETRRESGERHPLLRIKVWKDDPKAPVQVKPDVTSEL